MIKDVKISSYVMNIQPTPYFKLVLIKTTQRVMIYEPKHHIFWENFNCDAYHRGFASFLSDCSYDCIRDSDLIKMETISALD